MSLNVIQHKTPWFELFALGLGNSYRSEREEGSHPFLPISLCIGEGVFVVNDKMQGMAA